MKYLSKYSNGKEVSAAQYITELICEKKAKKDKKDLHYRFWIAKEWSLYYRNQISTANKLLSQFDSKAIVAALNNDKSKNIYSLRAPHLLPIIEEEETKIKSQSTEMKITIDRKQEKVFSSSKNIKSTSIISKLKDIDNDS